MESLKFGDQDVEGSTGAGENVPEVDAVVGSSLPATAAQAHGTLGYGSWALPTLARACREDARPGYKTMKAHEYLDDPSTLKAKVGVLADLVRRSQNCVAYTGAGISTASGINDYATKADNSIAAGRKISPWEAQPTLAHRVLVALHKAG